MVTIRVSSLKLGAADGVEAIGESGLLGEQPVKADIIMHSTSARLIILKELFIDCCYLLCCSHCPVFSCTP